MTPFQHILGAAFDSLPAPVRALHALDSCIHTSGRAEITASANPVAWLLCRVAGLPKPGSDVPVSVSFHPDGHGTELWDRRFACRRYASVMEAGRRDDEGLLIEHFGPFDLLFRLDPDDNGLKWSLAGWRLLGLTLPGWSRPTIECSETSDAERFVFDIHVTFPLVGHVVHYRGWLAPTEKTSTAPALMREGRRPGHPPDAASLVAQRKHRPIWTGGVFVVAGTRNKADIDYELVRFGHAIGDVIT